MELLIVSLDELFPATKAAINGMSNEFGILVTYKRLGDASIDEWSGKILVAGAEAFRLIYTGGEVPKAKPFTVYGYNGCPLYYAKNPNGLIIDVDEYTLFKDILSFVVKHDPEFEFPRVPYKYIQSRSELYHLDIPTPDYGTIDIETTGLDYTVEGIRLLGFTADGNFFIVSGTLFQYEEVLEKLRTIFHNETTRWYAQNFNQFDAIFLRQYGINVQTYGDFMLMDYAASEAGGADETESISKGHHSLDAIAAKYLGIPSWKTISDYASVDKITLVEYLVKDLWVMEELINPVFCNDNMEDGVVALHDTLLLPLAKTIGKIQEEGVLLDTEYLCYLAEIQEKAIEKLNEEIFDLAHEEVNVKSAKQVSKFLYETLRLKPQFSIKASEAGTDAISLANLKHYAADKVLECRKVMQIYSMFTIPLLQIVKDDGFIHPNYLLHGTVTGRLACVKPNLMQLPSGTDDLLNIKRAFVPADGHVFIDVDYSQLEVRVAAWYSQDPYLLNIYQNGKDLHCMVASDVFRVPESEVSKVQRSAAKNVSFGVLYSIGPAGLAEQIRYKSGYPCTEDEATKFIERFYEKVPYFSAWAEYQRMTAISSNKVYTPLGRYRRFPYITRANKSNVLRKAVNMPIQALASDICLTSVMDLANQLDPNIARVVLTVHDSILIEVREQAVGEILPLVKAICENKNHLLPERVPFTIEAKVGVTYGDLKEIGNA